jgi:hypothetical protein
MTDSIGSVINRALISIEALPKSRRPPSTLLTATRLMSMMMPRRDQVVIGWQEQEHTGDG